jgi:hypothetical protein
MCGIAIAVLWLPGCGGGGQQQQGTATLAPVRLEYPRSEIPSPGLCRIAERGLTRSCNGIENEAQTGQTILFRPRDGTRRVVVCYLHRSNRGQIEGIDVFDIDTRDLVEVVQRRGDPAPPGGCQEALN